MGDYQISARKYRPKSFNEVVGQEVITSTLENAVTTKQLSQALLFTGPRGVGKTSCARILARMINEGEIYVSWFTPKKKKARQEPKGGGDEDFPNLMNLKKMANKYREGA